MKEEMKQLLKWINKEKTNNRMMADGAKKDKETYLYFEGKDTVFSLCIEKIKEICGCDGK
jgi:hypothetical protein